MSKKLTIITITLLAALAGALFYIYTPKAPTHAKSLAQPRPLTTKGMATLDGLALKDYLKGKWTILSFGFTDCPDICPKTLMTFKQMRQRGEKLGLSSVQFAFVTVDPQKDTKEKLKVYIPYFDNKITGIRGSLEATKEFALSLASSFGRDKKTKAIYHTENFYLIDPEGRWAAYIRPRELSGKVIYDDLNLARLKSRKGFF